MQAWITVMGVDHSEIEDRQEVYVIPADKVREFEAGTDYQTVAEYLRTSYGAVLVVEVEE